MPNIVYSQSRINLSCPSSLIYIACDSLCDIIDCYVDRSALLTYTQFTIN